MKSHRLGCSFSVVTAHRIDDGQVLRERNAGTPRLPGQLELKANCLAAEPLNSRCRSYLSAHGYDLGVELLVARGVGFPVSPGDRILHLLGELPQLLRLGSGYALGSFAGAQSLEGTANFCDFHGFVDGYSPHPCATVLDTFDKAFDTELRQSDADVASAGSVVSSKVSFYEALFGYQFTADNCLSQQIRELVRGKGRLGGCAYCRHALSL